MIHRIARFLVLFALCLLFIPPALAQDACDDPQQPWWVAIACVLYQVEETAAPAQTPGLAEIDGVHIWPSDPIDYLSGSTFTVKLVHSKYNYLQLFANGMPMREWQQGAPDLAQYGEGADKPVDDAHSLQTYSIIIGPSGLHQGNVIHFTVVEHSINPNYASDPTKAVSQPLALPPIMVITDPPTLTVNFFQPYTEPWIEGGNAFVVISGNARQVSYTTPNGVSNDIVNIPGAGGAYSQTIQANGVCTATLTAENALGMTTTPVSIDYECKSPEKSGSEGGPCGELIDCPPPKPTTPP